MKPTLKSIKINADEYPTIVGDIFEDGADFKDGKLEGTKKATKELSQAINALMPIVHEVCDLGDKWLDMLGTFSRVSGVVLKEGGVVITAQLKHDYADTVKCAIANTPFIKFDELSTEEELLLETLKREAQIYLDTLPVQGDMFADQKTEERAMANFKDAAMPAIERATAEVKA